jgi:signal transduction histidine kinase
VQLHQRVHDRQAKPGAVMAACLSVVDLRVSGKRLRNVLLGDTNTVVGNAQTRSHDGAGLGLPIVNALMKLHGGSLTLESEVGQGTTVSLHFPPAVTLAKAA